jgi:hypothetical protein
MIAIGLAMFIMIIVSICLAVVNVMMECMVVRNMKLVDNR